MKLNKNINLTKVIVLSIISIITLSLFLFINLNFNFLGFFLEIRIPKILSFIIVSICIGAASIIFQSIINNRIVTPCLLGMNSLYILIHTLIAAVLGTSSIIFSNSNLIFIIDVLLMGFLGYLIYGTLFKKTKHNILYILLSGTVLATLFTSISSTLTRVMDPNQYDTLLTTLVSSFNNINSSIIILATLLMILVFIFLYKEIQLLDVITLGKNQAINLGVDYDKTVRKLLIGVVFLITIATALVGPISFLGLIIANLSRELFKTYKHKYLIFGSILMGVIVLSFGQLIIEHVLNFSTVISVFINLFGGIYFLYLIIRKKGGM